MLRKYGIVLIALSLVCALSACTQKEGADDAEALEATSMEAEPAIVPGEMVFVPAGEFILGTDDKESNAYFPARTMDLSAFWIDKYEVTNAEYLDFSVENSYIGEGVKEGKDWKMFFSPDKANVPVVYITYNDTEAYCKAKGKRLPTEYEWEKAARGTEGIKYPWGNEWDGSLANTYELGYDGAIAIGSTQDISPYGVHDMLGNVQEWTSTKYAPYKGNSAQDPNTRVGMRVLRGLSYNYKGKLNNIFIRSGVVPNALYNFGFRCARDATPEEIAEHQQAE
ncbi:MAG: SUMF1/EgtB/PvdO family nonheme iron enzyme [Acidobacteriota bacterium]|jgi:formylglycine-generating enzyme required for sulfatase activity